MGSKSEPTVVFDSDFVLDREYLLKFINYCMDWARKLHSVTGSISLKFTYEAKSLDNGSSPRRQVANFMWQGNLFVQIIPAQVHLEESSQYCYCLINKTLNTSTGRYYIMSTLWDLVFCPNLRAAIKQEVLRLNKKDEDIIKADIISEVEKYTF